MLVTWQRYIYSHTRLHLSVMIHGRELARVQIYALHVWQEKDRRQAPGGPTWTHTERAGQDTCPRNKCKPLNNKMCHPAQNEKPGPRAASHVPLLEPSTIPGAKVMHAPPPNSTELSDPTPNCTAMPCAQVCLLSTMCALPLYASCDVAWCSGVG